MLIQIGDALVGLTFAYLLGMITAFIFTLNSPRR